MRKFILPLLLVSILASASTCRRRDPGRVTVAAPEKFTTFNTLTSRAAANASDERIRNLMFNTLVRKNENFEYVGELAKDITTSEDGVTLTFTLREGVKFHNGQGFSSADVKYTFDKLFESTDGTFSAKSGAFYDAAAASPAPTNTAAAEKPQRIAHIKSIETPDAKTVVFKVARPALANQLLSNLVAVPIIGQGTAEQLDKQPIGSGPFRFESGDPSQGVVDLAAFTEYWEGTPKVEKLQVKTLTDATSLQAELSTGAVDIAPNPSNLPPDTLKSLSSNAALKVVQSDGSNIQYLIFNVESAPLNNQKVRQAIGYAIDRQKIVSELLHDQAKVADSVVPTQSWAYASGTRYSYDPARAKQLLSEAGYKEEPIVFKYGSGSALVGQYSQAIQSSLAAVGLNVQIETLDRPTIIAQLGKGQFQMFTGIWVGGNQDPIFLQNLFSSSRIPSATVPCCNRGRYANPEVDRVIEEAVNSIDKAKAKELYGKAWDLISADMPFLPLWYPANIVVANRRIDNININASGDWGFLKDITVSN